MKILVYDDNPDYGGHQIMSCHGVEALTADPDLEVIFMFNPRNTQLADCIAGIPNLQILEASCTTRKLQGLLNRIDPRGIQRLERELHALKPDLVLCIQGEIEDSSQAVLAARRAGIECLSYLAIPHPMQRMGARWGRLRDHINQYLLNQPDRYITLSESMAGQLKERGVSKPVAVVPNGIPPPPTPDFKPQTSNLVLGLIGRVEFNQKQQDFMVQTFRAFPETFQDSQLLIAGSGPDEERLKQLISGNKNIAFLPWQDDTEALYKQIDFLVIPSRYEGVPLVLLEALARGIPVIASACDGMQDILPESWIFEPENAAALANTFSNIRDTWRNDIAALQQKVLSAYSLECFKSNFHRAICSQDQ